MMPDWGLFDFPAVLFDLLQSLLDEWLPAWLSIVLWALLAAFLSMWIYAQFSNQTILAELKPRQRDARKRLAVYDGPFKGLPPLIRENLALSGQHLWLTLWPALLASLPLLFLLPWLSNTFGVYFPEPGTPVAVTVQSYTPYGLHWSPAAAAEQTGTGRWILSWPETGDLLTLQEKDNVRVLSLPPAQPSPVLHKRLWWNALLGNPAGYLAPDSIVEELSLALPEHELIPFGPVWLRGWLALFLLALVLFSLYFKWLWRLR